MTEQTTAAEPWRIGSHYKIHVYAGDRPVATFHRAEDAARAVEAVNARPFPNAPGDPDASPTSSGPALASSIAAEPAVTKTGTDLAPTPPEPSGLVDAVRVSLPIGLARDALQFVIDGRCDDDNAETESLRDDVIQVLDAALSGQQGGAVPAGDLPRLTEQMIRDACHGFYKSENIDGVSLAFCNTDYTFREAFRRMWASMRRGVRARLAEQPAPIGLRDPSPVDQPIPDFDFTPAAFVSKLREVVAADKGLVVILPGQATRDMLAWAETVSAGTGASGVEGLRPGLKKALEIVRAEMETASSSSGSYQRLGSVGLALRAALDGASGRGEKAGDAQN